MTIAKFDLKTLLGRSDGWDDRLALFNQLADALAEFVHDLPLDLVVRWERKRETLDLSIKAPSPRHRRLVVSASPDEIEYQMGKLWTERLDVTPEIISRILAACDAVRAGRVKEVKDRRTGLFYHIYRLNTRGLDTFMHDSEHSLLHCLRLKVRQVHVHTVPALDQTSR